MKLTTSLLIALFIIGVGNIVYSSHLEWKIGEAVRTRPLYIPCACNDTKVLLHESKPAPEIPADAPQKGKPGETIVH